MVLSSNSYWYIGLSALSLLLFIYIYVKVRNAHILLLFLVMVELAYLIETVIYVFGDSYQYYPQIIKYNAYYDSNLGALSSNMLAIPAIAVFLAVFHLNWKWMLGCVALFAGIEYLFLQLGIYDLHWWRIPYTSLGLPVYFILAKKLYRRIFQPLKGLAHSLFLFLCIGPVAGTMQVLPIMLFDNREYRPGWFADYARDTTAFVIPYYLTAILIMVVLVKTCRKRPWIRYVVMEAVLVTATLVLKRTGILHSKVWWDSLAYVLFPLLVLAITSAISRRLERGAQPILP
jgi:hypothetical protein